MAVSINPLTSGITTSLAGKPTWLSQDSRRSIYANGQNAQGVANNHVTVTTVTNLLTGPRNLNNAAWNNTTASVRITDSMVRFDGVSGNQVGQSGISLTNGNTYMAYIEARCLNANAYSTTYGYPGFGMMLTNGTNALNLTTIDHALGAGGRGYCSLRPYFSGHTARFVNNATGTSAVFKFLDNNVNGAFDFEVAFVGLYDITGLSGVLYDSTNDKYISIQNNVTAWGDSLSSELWQCRDTCSWARYNNNGGWNGGGKTTSQILTEFQTNGASLYGEPTLIWMGHNNVASVGNVALATTKSDFQTLIGSLTNDYRILTCVYNSTWTGSRTADADYIDKLNEWLIGQYGPRVIDVRETIMAYSDGSANDLAEVRNRSIPISLINDSNIHLTHKGRDAVADLVYTNLGNSWT